MPLPRDEWRERAEERLSSLTASETVQNDRLDEHDEEFHALREMIDGKEDNKDDNGIHGDIKELSRKTNLLYNIMAPDSLGEGGVINRLKALEKKEAKRERSYEYKWKFWTAVAVALLSLVGFILKDWPDIEQAIFKDKATGIQKPAASTLKHRKHHHVVQRAPEEEPETPEPEAEPATNEQ